MARPVPHQLRFPLSIPFPHFLLFALFLIGPVPALYGAGPRFLESEGALLRGSDSGFQLDTPTRIKIDLSGPWTYEIDGGANGSVRLPAAYDFTGTVEFQRSFMLPPAQLDSFQFQLVGLGVNYTCEISVNGEYIGTHSGGSTTFGVDIPRNFLRDSAADVIRLVVNNRLSARGTIPLRPALSSVRNYGGITRDIYILGRPRTYIKDVVARAELNESMSLARITVRGIVDGEDLTSAPRAYASERPRTWVPGFYVEMIDKVSGVTLGRSGVMPVRRNGNRWDTTDAAIVLPNPKLWSPDTPDLYLMKCHLVQASGRDVSEVDEYDFTYGVRKIAIDKGHIMLNGSRVILKGVDWHEDSPAHGSALTYAEREKDIILIKNLGANLVRFVDHPPHPYMLNLCDRYGLLAMEELPLANAPAVVLVDPAFADMAAGMAEEMITRDRNHPSVLAWGIGREFETGRPESRQFAEQMVRTLKSLDSRFTYYVARLDRDEQCSRVVDIAAVDLDVPDMKDFTRRLERWHQSHRSQPVVAADLGCEVQSWNHNGYQDPFSIEAQARFFLQHIEAISAENYDGTIISAFNDWKGNHPSLTVHSGDPWLHTRGLVDAHRERRLAYDAVRSVFRNERFVALPRGKATSHEPIVYVLIGFVVLIALAYFYNANRRFRENVKRSLFNSYNFYADIRDLRIVSVLHTALLGVVVSIATAIVFSSILYHSRGSWILDNILSSLLVIDTLKAEAIRLIWNPLDSVVSLSIAVFAALLLQSAMIWMLRWVFKTKIYAYHAFAVTFWSAAPLLLFVPVGMVLFRVMESGIYVIPSFVFVALFLLWVAVRLLKGTSIVLDVYPPKMFVVGIGSLLSVCALVYFYYDYTQGVSAYLPMLFHALKSSP